MLLRINTARRSATTCSDAAARILGRSSPLLPLIALLTFATAVPFAKPAAAVEPRPAVVEDETLPDPADLVSAYLTARRWVDAFDLPGLDASESRLHIENGAGVCVHLRRSGRVLGSAVIAPTRHLENDLKLRRALGRAMSQVLGDSAVSRLPDQMRDEVGRSLVLELEVAGTPEPLIARSYRHVARQIEPGVHGVALRRGDRWAMLFPSQLLATNGAKRLDTRIAVLAEELGLAGAADLESLVSNHDVSVYRFRTAHLVQTAPDQLPHETFRGDRLVSQAGVDRDSIAEAADALTGHLLARLWPDAQHPDLPADIDIETAPAMLGDYRPVADRYDPLIAPPFEQALTAFALTRYAKNPDADQEAAASARDAAILILEKLSDDPSFALNSPATAAALIYALTELDLQPHNNDTTGEVDLANREESSLDHLRHEARELVMQSFDDGAFRPHGRDGDAPHYPPHIQAILAGAAVRSATSPHERLDEDTAASLRAMLDAVWDRAPEHESVGLQPWLGWAEVDLARALDRRIAHADRFRQIRLALYEVQVGFDDPSVARLPAPDLHGGFVLAGHRRPDSQSIRPMIWLAAMMQSPELSDPEDQTENLERLRAMMRFLKQLTVRESAIWSLRNPDRALGGVRNALWDSDQPLAAQAMGLLAFSEALRVLEHGPRPD